YTQDMFTSPIIEIAVSKSSAIIENCVFSEMVNTPVDSIMAISADSISFSGCVLQGLKFYEDNGCLVLVSGAITLQDTIFKNNQAELGQKRGGALIVLVNPIEDFTMEVSVQNCSFEGNLGSLIAFEN